MVIISQLWKSAQYPWYQRLFPPLTTCGRHPNISPHARQNLWYLHQSWSLLQGGNFAVIESSSVPLVPETFPPARGLRPTPKHPTARETQTSGTHSYNLMAVLFQELMRSFQLEMRTSVLPRLLVALREVFWLFQSWTSRQTHGIYNCQALQQHCLQSKE